MTLSYYNIAGIMILTLTMLNFLNGIIHLTCFALSIIIFRDIKMKTKVLKLGSQYLQYRVWSVCADVLYTGGEGYSLSVLAG